MVEEMNDCPSAAESSLQKLKGENERLKEMVNSLEADVRKNATYKEEVSELNQMVALLSSEVENLKLEETTTKKITVTSPDISARASATPDEIWKEEMKKLQNEVNSLQEREKIRARASTHLTKQDHNLHIKLETLTTEMKQLQRDFADKNTSHQRLEKQNAALEGEVKELKGKLQFTIEKCGNDVPCDAENPLPSLEAIAGRLSVLDTKYSLHSCSWRSLGLVLQAKMQSDPVKRSTLFSKAQWH
mmetsp:Transcript_108523/g.162327  ORF Transcript_108523/g.162327 Transcript_108523/m.162327 type:complete len:246 (+) Transcript_108523:20-757(+)|eukprot:CAMPEP_0117048096 /NCGR_PEP_ID=MMETSP0472-20121206/33232_1 /TAXON_ID=693140 ORGANISM="Tiarina fusus, Strain LIS" /NCGR_SAMPLE_ID=MMETSP0472 /ASSEMBLY_ACC=CAM_ASM_000603 /LENGTH=245 /DNA_ID=CAMNT_0004761035 /DNA_START=17 /DNA_END=754 /DNA_ORIENTATION=-